MTRKLLAALISVLILITAVPGSVINATAEESTQQQEVLRPTIKILSIGHSFSVDAMETYMWDLFDAAGYDATIAYLFYPGASLERHYHYVKDNSCSYDRYSKNSDGTWVHRYDVCATDALWDEDWDIVTFQPSPDYGKGTMPSPCEWGCNSNPENDYVHFDSLVDTVRNYLRSDDNPYGPNEDVQFYYHLTWAFATDCKLWSFLYSDYDQMKMYKDFINATQTYVLTNARIRGVIPCITSVQNARTTWMGDTFNEPGGYYRDGYHLNDKGDLVAAMTWVAYFTGKSATDFSVNTDYDPWEYAAIAAAVDDAIRTPWSVTTPTWNTPHDHTSQETVTAQPTCGEQGQALCTCTSCGLSYIKRIPPTGNHTYDSVCDAVCVDCGSDRIPPHSYINDCDEECDLCGTTREITHIFNGSLDTDCDRCGYTRTFPSLSVGSHSFDVPNDEPVICIFTPDEDGIYAFSSYGSLDAYASLYDADQFCVIYDDDSGDDLNFFFESHLLAGETYYISVSHYSYAICEVNLLIEKTSTDPASLLGDINSDSKINNRDLGLLQQYLSDWGVPIDELAADTNCDGRINNRDLGLLQQYLSDWDVTLGR